MKLSDKSYTILKWLTLICIPAFTACYVGLSAVWGWPYAEEIAKTSAVICTLIGSLIGISSAQYYADKAEPALVECENPENLKLIADILAADAEGKKYENT